MTALDSRPQVPTAPAVSREVAARRANGVKSGRPLTVSELDAIRDLELTSARGATNIGDCDTYVLNLLGISTRSMQQEIEARQWALSCDPYDGSYDREIAERQANVRRGAA